MLMSTIVSGALYARTENQTPSTLILRKHAMAGHTGAALHDLIHR